MISFKNHVMRNLITIVSLLFVLQSEAQQVNYLNQGNATAKPMVFAQGIISDGLINRDFTISPKGDELFFTIQHKDFISIMILKHSSHPMAKRYSSAAIGKLMQLILQMILIFGMS
jgi:hypothetical protein